MCRPKFNVIVAPKKRLRSDVWTTYMTGDHPASGVVLFQVKRSRGGGWRKRNVWSREPAKWHSDQGETISEERGKELYEQAKAR